MSEGPPTPAATLAHALVALLDRAQQGADAPMTAAARNTLLRAFLRVLVAIENGDSCTTLAELAADVAGPHADAAMILACQQRVRADLLSTGAMALAHRDLSAPLPSVPLVLDPEDRLFLRRHFAAEYRVAKFFHAATNDALAPGPEALRYLRTLAPAPGEIDWQVAAVTVALTRRVAVVTGGPGTGKTTTILRILAALHHDQHNLQIALVAPTGKAALRMDAARTQLLAAHPDAAVARASTLHRLLGFRPGEDTFARGRGSTLPVDVVVVDEASMVDLELMDALLAALRPDARLLLLGDRDQLSAIGAGQVLADLCDLARPELGASRALAAHCRDWLSMDLPTAPTPTPLGDCVVALRKVFRFDSSSSIAAFARAVARRRPEDALAALQRDGSDLVLVPHAPLDKVLRSWLPRCLELCEATAPQHALALQQRLRVLCAVHQGPFGKDAVNAYLELRLRPRGISSGDDYPGRPILITTNDHASGLMNGDLGVLWPDEAGRLLAWFEGPKGQAPRSILPLRLPPHETAWAITVHKSQGSEFDHVLVMLPDRPSPLLDAPLLYTAITRAKKSATVVADLEVVQRALATGTGRRSGLCDWLKSAPPEHGR